MEEKLHVLWMKKQRLGAEARLLQAAYPVKLYLVTVRGRKKKTKAVNIQDRAVSLNFQAWLLLSC